MRTKNKLLIIVAILVVIVVVQGYKDFKVYLAYNKIQDSYQDLMWKASYVEPPLMPIVDGATYSDDDMDVQVEKLYVTVLPTQDEAFQNILFKDLNAIMDFEAFIPTMNAMVTIDDGDYPLVANGIITLRGHSTVATEQKSYKIKLDAEAEAWYGQKTINLSKHPYDDLRIRNKIAFDLFENVPDFTSMETRFIQLFVKDLSEGEESAYVDYGLFTSIEQADKAFLKNHGLDEFGALYKANYYEFLPYEALKNINDPDYNAEDFEVHLEINVSTSHNKIIEMNNDVNNYHLDINQVLNKHFNRDNYFTWLAVNILLGNYDTQTQNFFLYNPHDLHTWYFLPWDYDGSMDVPSDMLRDVDGVYTQLIGIANYWNSTLHARVFQKTENVKELNQKIEDVYKILTQEVIEEEVDKYLPVLKEYFFNEPVFLDEVGLETFESQRKEIENVSNKNRQQYYDTIEKPMPIFLGDIEKTEAGTYFVWDESFDLQGDALTYSLQVSKQPNFTQLDFERYGLTDTSLTVKLPAGEYFWRVIVEDAKGNTQRAFDYYDIGDYNFYFGLKKITVE